eukprot:4532613-Amphidinium_carterae.1
MSCLGGVEVQSRGPSLGDRAIAIPLGTELTNPLMMSGRGKTIVLNQHSWSDGLPKTDQESAPADEPKTAHPLDERKALPEHEDVKKDDARDEVPDPLREDKADATPMMAPMAARFCDYAAVGNSPKGWLNLLKQPYAGIRLQ